MNRSGFAEALARSMTYAEDDEAPRPKLAPDAEAIRLRDALDAFTTKHEFAPRMIVRQKREAMSYSNLGDNGHAIVVDVLDEPIVAEGPVGSQHFRDRFDMVIGVIAHHDDHDEFALFHVDSRRFEPVPDEELALVTRPAEGPAPRADRAGPPTPRRAA